MSESALVSELKSLVLRSLSAGIPLPGLERALALPDAQSALGPHGLRVDSSAPRVDATEAVDPHTLGETIAFIRVDQAEASEDRVSIRVEVAAKAPGSDKPQPLSSAVVTFERIGDSWVVAEHPRLMST